MIDTLLKSMLINVVSYTKQLIFLTNIGLKRHMTKNSNDYKYCIEIALENAKKRIQLLDSSEKKCVLEEYKEWMNEGFNYQSILLLREDPII